MVEQSKDTEKSEGYKCSECGEEFSKDNAVCPICGVQFQDESVPEHVRQDIIEQMSPSYPALETIATLYKAIAYLVLLIGIGLPLFMISRGGEQSIIPSVGVFFIAIVLFVILLANSEMIKLYLSIEQNTSRAVELLTDRREKDAA
jgi:hypothetical protein